MAGLVPGPDRPGHPADRVQFHRAAVADGTAAVRLVPRRPRAVPVLLPLQERQHAPGVRAVAADRERHRGPAGVAWPRVVPAGVPARDDRAVRPGRQVQVQQRAPGHGPHRRAGARDGTGREPSPAGPGAGGRAAGRGLGAGEQDAAGIVVVTGRAVRGNDDDVLRRARVHRDALGQQGGRVRRVQGLSGPGRGNEDGGDHGHGGRQRHEPAGDVRGGLLRFVSWERSAQILAAEGLDSRWPTVL